MFSIIYAAIRIILPVGSFMNPEYVDIDLEMYFSNLYYAMPMIHFTELILTAGQAMFYLMLNEERAKFIQLFQKSFLDIIPFLMIFALIILQTILCLHVLGASFDSGGNYNLDDPNTPLINELYDSDHYDYQMVPYFGVIVAANIRTSIGDLQPPGYNYWVESFSHAKDMSRFYIGMIWFVYFVSLIMTVILSLNFLIAIVS